MNIMVKLLPQGKDIGDVEISDGSTGLELLGKLNLAPDAHIMTREGNPIPMDEELKDGENIEIIQVISGG